jgi:hypothetical protein
MIVAPSAEQVPNQLLRQELTDSGQRGVAPFGICALIALVAVFDSTRRHLRNVGLHTVVDVEARVAPRKSHPRRQLRYMKSSCLMYGRSDTHRPYMSDCESSGFGRQMFAGVRMTCLGDLRRLLDSKDKSFIDAGGGHKCGADGYENCTHRRQGPPVLWRKWTRSGAGSYGKRTTTDWNHPKKIGRRMS